MPSLTGVEGPLKGQVFSLQAEAILGRSMDATIRLDDSSVSRHHAKLTVAAGTCTVEDLGSSNGTFVNGAQIAGPTALKEGDQVRLSGHVFRFTAAEPAKPGGPTPTPRGAIMDLSAKAPAIQRTLDVHHTFMNLRVVDADSNALRVANERFQTVLAVSNAVQTKLNMEDLLSDILDRLFQVFPHADRGLILLKEDGSEELTPRAARQRGREQVDTIKTSRTVLQRAVQERQSILSADAMTDDRFSSSLTIAGLRMRSMMCVPLIANEEVLGVVHLDTMRQDKQFTPDDLDLLTGVTNQIALAIANARLHRKLLVQQRMERDLQLARQVQESFLPDKLPDIKAMQFAATYKAALEIGGDFYDFIPLAGGKLAVVVGDVAGKGIPAALLMARMVSDVRALAIQEEDPTRVVRQLNEGLCARNANDSFVTLVFAILDPDERSLRLVNAAHPPPLVRKASGQVVAIEGEANFPVGAVEGSEFQQEEFRLAPGDILCLYSDGISEAMDAEKKMYGIDRLKIAVGGSPASPRQVLDHIVKDVQAHVGNAYQSDDLTIVCCGAT